LFTKSQDSLAGEFSNASCGGKKPSEAGLSDSWFMFFIWKFDFIHPILCQVSKIDVGQFAAQTIETWSANSSTGSTPTAIKNIFPWQLTLFQSPLT